MEKKSVKRKSNESGGNQWIDYRNQVAENKSKSQDDFEKYINLMASGGLVLSLTFLEKIVTIDKAVCKFFIVIGMFSLVLTILSNLYSHYKSMVDSDLTIVDIDEEKFDTIFKNVQKRNKVINGLNKISIWSFILGILAIVIFVSINLFSMSDKPKPTHNPAPKPLTEEKGRTVPPPPQNRPSSNPKK